MKKYLEMINLWKKLKIMKINFLKTNYYTMEKNKKEQEKEEKEIRDRNLAKIELRKYLDMQVEEKKKNSELEKELEKEQARIWKMDCEKYARDEKVIDDKMFLILLYY